MVTQVKTSLATQHEFDTHNVSSVVCFCYDPFTEFDLFKRHLQTPSRSSEVIPKISSRTELNKVMDLHENNETNTVTATFELPGLKPEDISIEIQQNRLTVSGEFKKTESRDEAGYAFRERRQGKFSRTLQLPIGVKSEDVKAKLENGLLTLTFPQVIPEQQPHRITIS
ncbi:hypothetical protein M404DRAFT_149837 [Pisolithus tinctorius Marx 270]|uniref:Uncharacterized protein n=1 Tax=Pisolithus tinctorius Marx 270 TaxID=870435 RepID=A0A0C3P231_PISTI|nr:hypothetical protein M404DRAFT_149837 [Pisolithus tinctorius Marx 270]